LISIYFYLQNGARKAALLKDDNLISFLYEDAKTVYEVFQRGLRVSGKRSLGLKFTASQNIDILSLEMKLISTMFKIAIHVLVRHPGASN